METIAVYWEQRIKNYGFQSITGLSLLDLSFPVERMDRWGLALKELNRESDRFYFVLSQTTDRDVLRMLILVEGKTLDNILAEADRLTNGHPRPFIQTSTPVEAVHFQGPHFGDRYGVADAAFQALAEAAVPILAAGCAGSSVYLVLPDGRGREAIAALSQNFDAAG